MVKTVHKSIHIYFIDHDTQFVTKIANRFIDKKKYNFHIYSAGNKFFKEFETRNDLKSAIHIVFLSTNLEIDEDGNTVEAIDVLQKIKKISSDASVVIYSENDDINYVTAAFDHGIYTFIRKNENIELRFENSIKGIISQKTFIKHRKGSFLISKIFIAFLFVLLLILLLLYIFSPELLKF